MTRAKQYHAVLLVLLQITGSSSVRAFAPTTSARIRTMIPSNSNQRQPPLHATANNQVMDELLEESNLKSAVTYLQNHPNDIEMTPDRLSRVFDAIEVRTAEAEENTLVHGGEYPLTSPARTEMTNMYDTLKSQDHLQLFGAASSIPPAAGSHAVSQQQLEQASDLSMTSLTPKPTNTLLLAGVVLAVIEAIASLSLGIDLNFLAFGTLLAALADKLFLNGLVYENLVKLVMPGISEKVGRHEAGHFLCAYLMGCPVEGSVLNAWDALQDARFKGVAAGTSFYDPHLSSEVGSGQIKQSTLDRYSIIVLGGVAAEALHYGQADGGSGDEAALVALLSTLGTSSKWSNALEIKNQARWGALQAVLLLREYKPAYDALLKTMQTPGYTLGDCIQAIETAGKQYGLKPLDKPVGLLLDKGDFGEWTTNIPTEYAMPVTSVETASRTASGTVHDDNDKNAEEMLQEYRTRLTEKLRVIEEQIKDIET